MMVRTTISALSFAVKLLARRDYGERELTDKLAQKGYERDEINSTLQILRERGYVNDHAFACKLAASLWRSGKYGISGVRSQLRRRGLSESVINAAVAEFDYEQELVTAAALLARRNFSCGEKDKAGRFLAARGFSTSVIGRVLKNLATNSDF